MRLLGLCASALAVIALAAPQDDPVTTSMSKATVTRTVMRVIETVTATQNGTLSTYQTTTTETSTIFLTPYASATGHLPAYSNGTSTVLGTSARPSVSKTSSSAPTQTTNAGGKFGVEAMSLAAVVGLVGLAVY